MNLNRAIAAVIFAHIAIAIYCLCPRNASALEIIVYATQPVKSKPDIYITTSFRANNVHDDPTDGFLTKVFSTLRPSDIFDFRQDYGDDPDIYHEEFVHVIRERYKATKQFCSLSKIQKRMKRIAKKVPIGLSTIREDREDSKEEKE